MEKNLARSDSKLSYKKILFEVMLMTSQKSICKKLMLRIASILSNLQGIQIISLVSLSKQKLSFAAILNQLSLVALTEQQWIFLHSFKHAQQDSFNLRDRHQLALRI